QQRSASVRTRTWSRGGPGREGSASDVASPASFRTIPATSRRKSVPLGSLETIAIRVESGATQRLTTCLPSSQGAVTSAGPPASLDASKVQILAAPAACPATQRRPSDAYIGLVRPVPNGGTVTPVPPRHRASSARLAETPA